MGEDSESCCQSKPSKRDQGAPRGLAAYLPLFVIIALTALAALAKQVSYGGWNARWGMHDFMGLFLVVFAMVKFFDLGGFAKGFQKYDLLASRSKSYALLYPFLELSLGLGYLSHLYPEVIYLGTIVLLGFGALGVLNAMRQGKDLKCACMGNLLDVPVSVVTLTEDVGMVVMAAAMWLL